MSERARYLFTVSMDIAPDKEELFNELYDSEHLPFLRAVPGVVGARRTVAEPLVAVLRGERQEVLSGARYTTVYELEDPSVIASEAWIVASNAGRWDAEIRPFASNVELRMLRLLGEDGDRA